MAILCSSAEERRIAWGGKGGCFSRACKFWWCGGVFKSCCTVEAQNADCKNGHTLATRLSHWCSVRSSHLQDSISRIASRGCLCLHSLVERHTTRVNSFREPSVVMYKLVHGESFQTTCILHTFLFALVVKRKHWTLYARYCSR